MIDFIISFNLFGEFYIFDNWDAAEERKRKEIVQASNFRRIETSRR